MSAHISRRQLLAWGFSAAAWPRLHAAARAEDKPTRRVDVLVIGAGISGLSAARELSQQHNVLVLEGRDRIGGRIWSDRPWGGQVLDMGASWIHGIRGNPIHELVQELKIKTFPTDSEKHWLYRDGPHEYEDREQAVTENRVKKLLAAAAEGRKESHQEKKPDISLLAAINKLIANRNYTPLEHREIDFQLSSLIEQEYAADVNEMSNYYYDQGADFPGSDVLFPDGYVQIVRHVAEGLKIRRDHKVRRIEWDESKGVMVDTNQGQFEADFALVTLPLGVLQHGGVEFKPALSEDKLTAIGRMGVGLLNKTYLRFPRQFWPARSDWLGYVSEPRGRWSEYLNVAKFADTAILLGFTAATFARRMEKKSDNETVSDMMSALHGMFGRRVPDPTAAAITRWASDPFSFGSYSFLKLGAMPRDYDALAEPQGGRLFFAGEHTNRRYAATVHGAYLSGQRAAKQIAAAMKK